MQPRIYAPSLGKAARGADILMSPLMRLISGAPTETPQQTHHWNYRRLTIEKVCSLDRSQMVRREGIPTEGAKCGIRFHIAIINGWTRYVVLEPESFADQWHIGWSTTNKHGFNCGVSRIPLRGAVRMLIGPEHVFFFGIEASRFTQIALKDIGDGSIGDGGSYSQIPLL